MTFKIFFGILFFVAVNARAEDSAVPLIISAKGGVWTVAVDALVDGHQRRFDLDTGSSASEVKSDPFSLTYPGTQPMGTKTGPSGQSVSCQWISLQNVSLDTIIKSSLMATRCEGDGGFDNLGINFFADSVLSIDSDKEQLRIGRRRPVQNLTYFPLIRSKSDLVYGLIELPVSIAGKNVNAMFDTGTSITAVDLRFVNAHPDKFEFQQMGTGSDITQTDFQVSVYRTKDFKIGSLVMDNISIIAFDFANLRKDLGEDCPVILGNNVIFNSNWILDLHASEWAIEPVSPEKNR